MQILSSGTETVVQPAANQLQIKRIRAWLARALFENGRVCIVLHINTVRHIYNLIVCVGAVESLA